MKEQKKKSASELLLTKKIAEPVDADEDGKSDDESEDYDDEVDEDDLSDEEGSDAQSEEEGDFFTSKKEQRAVESDVSDKEDEKEVVIADSMKVSKNKLKKITKDGPFQGKNKVFFDA